jgi:hypothetical protein
MTADAMTPARARHATRMGRIEYRTEQKGFPTGVWGFEDWRLTKHGDGSRTLRAYCELQDDPLVIRDVVQNVDAQFHPRDVFARLTIDDKFFGSSWYRFSDTEAELQGYTAAAGRIHETRPITRAMRGFGTHALMADAWLCARYDFSKGPGQQTFTNNLLTSLDHRGATGPAFTTTTTSTIAYRGIENKTVKAGTFACHRLAFVATSNNHPLYDLWITTDSDFLFVKGTVGAPYFWDFELTELRDHA